MAKKQKKSSYKRDIKFLEENNSFKKSICGRCKSVKIPIFYGIPHGLYDDIKKGKVKLGGCMALDKSYKFYCKKCKKKYKH